MSEATSCCLCGKDSHRLALFGLHGGSYNACPACQKRCGLETKAQMRKRLKREAAGDAKGANDA